MSGALLLRSCHQTFLLGPKARARSKGELGTNLPWASGKSSDLLPTAVPGFRLGSPSYWDLRAVFASSVAESPSVVKGERIQFFNQWEPHDFLHLRATDRQ